MNLSLRNRVSVSFILANAVILFLFLMVFNFFNSLKKDIDSFTVQSNKISVLTDELRISTISILKYQRRILVNRNNGNLVEKILERCEIVTSQLKRLDALYKDPEIKAVIARMLADVDTLRLVISKASLYRRDNVGVSTIGDLADKILEAFSEFQEFQQSKVKNRNSQIAKIVVETKQNMMLTLIIGFLGTILLNLVIPGKIALPFKKIKDAIRELQDCNFDVSIYYSEDDEIGEIAREMNKMIHSIKIFEELRADRISVENRKFDALANMVRRPVLVANAEGQLIYMNNQLYSILQCQSEDVIGKSMADSVIPDSIIQSYELAIKRRSKIENAEVIIPAKIEEKEKDEPAVVSEAEDGAEQEVEIVEPAPIYQGYANVIPIRGKDSSLDYYLMVLSKEVFV